MNLKIPATAHPANCILLLPMLLLPSPVPAAAAKDLPPPPPPRITGKTLLSRTWETVQQLQVGDRTILKTNSYIALQNGLHKFDPALNDYVETDCRIEPFQDGAVVRNLQYSVIFSPNLASPGAIDILLPDGKTRLAGQIM